MSNFFSIALLYANEVPFSSILTGMQNIKVGFLYFLKAVGLFKLMELYTKKSSTVLCYHGISNQDENQFLPANYISFDDFKNQIEKLQTDGFKFISLSELEAKMQSNTLNNKELVLTIDDGFKSIFDQMIPYLEENKIKSTLYVTTKESLNSQSIFRLLCNYVFWKTDQGTLDLSSLDLELASHPSNKIETKDHMKRWAFIQAIEKELGFEQRETVLKTVSEQLQIPINEELKKSFQIINYEDLNELELNYVDIQLHTHSHDMTMEEDLLEKDIIENRTLLKPSSKSPLVHFCYPSGVFKMSHLPLLKKLNINTATTCEQGMVKASTNPLLIPRLLVNSNMPQIVFEAELKGVMDTLRFAKT